MSRRRDEDDIEDAACNLREEYGERLPSRILAAAGGMKTIVKLGDRLMSDARSTSLRGKPWVFIPHNFYGRELEYLIGHENAEQLLKVIFDPRWKEALMDLLSRAILVPRDEIGPALLRVGLDPTALLDIFPSAPLQAIGMRLADRLAGFEVTVHVAEGDEVRVDAHRKSRERRPRRFNHQPLLQEVLSGGPSVRVAEYNGLRVHAWRARAPLRTTVTMIVEDPVVTRDLVAAPAVLTPTPSAVRPHVRVNYYDGHRPAQSIVAQLARSKA